MPSRTTLMPSVFGACFASWKVFPVTHWGGTVERTGFQFPPPGRVWGRVGWRTEQSQPSGGVCGPVAFRTFSWSLVGCVSVVPCE